MLLFQRLFEISLVAVLRYDVNVILGVQDSVDLEQVVVGMVSDVLQGVDFVFLDLPAELVQSLFTQHLYGDDLLVLAVLALVDGGVLAFAYHFIEEVGEIFNVFDLPLLSIDFHK